MWNPPINLKDRQSMSISLIVELAWITLITSDINCRWPHLIQTVISLTKRQTVSAYHIRSMRHHCGNAPYFPRIVIFPSSQAKSITTLYVRNTHTHTKINASLSAYQLTGYFFWTCHPQCSMPLPFRRQYRERECVCVCEESKVVNWFQSLSRTKLFAVVVCDNWSLHP